jgi:hypothetical protein
MSLSRVGEIAKSAGRSSIRQWLTHCLLLTLSGHPNAFQPTPALRGKADIGRFTKRSGLGGSYFKCAFLLEWIVL